MKKVAGAKPKSKRIPQSVEEYIGGIPDRGRTALQEIRAAIRSVVPAGTTEVISYGIPGFKHNRVLVWYAAFSDHCSLFPTAEIIAAFRDEVKGFTTSKGTIHFPLNKPMPIALIKKLVRARVARNQAKKS